MSITQYGSRPIHSPDRIFLIGDVHNEAVKLTSILDQIEPLLTDKDHVVFCGDLINRGKQPALTIETLISFTKRHPTQVFFVKGNHEEMLQYYLLKGDAGWSDYLRPTLIGLMGHWALPSLDSYTIAKALEEKGFREITSRTVPYYETDRIIATHAPIDRNTASVYGSTHYQQDFLIKDDLPGFTHLLDRMNYEITWNFTNDEQEGCPEIDKFLVCGHQPGHHKKPRLFSTHAYIDSGCGKGDRPLTCLVYPSKQVFQSV